MRAPPLRYGQAQEAEIRKQLRAQFATCGVPDASLDLVTDLTVHTAQSALDVMARVAQTAPDWGHLLAVLAPACSIVRDRCEHLEAALRDYARENGMFSTTGTIKFGGQS